MYCDVELRWLGSVQTTDRPFSIMNKTWNNTILKNPWPLSLALSTFIVKNREICDIFALICKIVICKIIWVCVIWHISELQFMKEKRRPDVSTLFTTFDDLSVSRNLFWNTKKRQFSATDFSYNSLITYIIQDIYLAPSCLFLSPGRIE